MPVNLTPENFISNPLFIVIYYFCDELSRLGNSIMLAIGVPKGYLIFSC